MRSWLFTPADQPRKIEKALKAGADAVILDLEDAVAETQKAAARDLLAESFGSFASDDAPPVWVRLNGLDTPHIGPDLDLIRRIASNGLAGLLLPKATPEGVRRLDTGLSDRGVAPLLPILAIATETPAAIFQLGGYGGVSKRLMGLTWGAEDLASAVGAQHNRDQQGLYTSPWILARNLTLFGASAAGLDPVDSVYSDFRNTEGLRDEALAAKRDGFVAKLAIHPAQVPVINEVFSWSEEEIARARRIIDAFEAAPDAGALQLDGVMLDKPHLVQARRVLRLAGV